MNFEGLGSSTTNCGYMYVPAKGDRKGKIPPGTPFGELPEDRRCPVCGASKKANRYEGYPAGQAPICCGQPMISMD